MDDITFTIFPHIYWDISSSAGNNLFKDYKDWFESSVKYILNNTDSKIIIKDHPSNLFKFKLLGLDYISPIKDFLNKLLSPPVATTL